MEYEHPGVIKYSLEKKDFSIVFSILEQNEATRNVKGYCDSTSKGYSDAWPIGSSSHCALDKAVVWLRGSAKSRDSIPASRTFDTGEERDVYYDKVVNGIARWAHLPKWDSIRTHTYKQEQLELW